MPSSNQTSRAAVSSHDVLFRERPDGYWDYFPKAHKGQGYRVDAAQREQLLRSSKHEQQWYAAGIAGLIAVYLPVSMRVLDSWFLKWGLLATVLLLLVTLSPTWILKARRRRLLKDTPRTQNTITLEELRYRSADLLPTLRIVLWLILFLALLIQFLVIAYKAVIFDNLMLLAAAMILVWFFGRIAWDWTQVYRIRRRLLRSRHVVPFVFD